MKKRIITILLCIIIIVLIFVVIKYQNTSSKRPQNYIELSQIQSTIDKDKDGIEDQTDILENALVYVDTHPKYKSKYYETGYPDDHYGVCTDVVAFVLKNSGYNLQILLEKDITEHPENYDIDEPDSNIDFRRVKNLYVYFLNNTINLTTDVNDYEEWQGGDIVVFKHHIGIVSDRRNFNNVPYVIHHNDCWQKKYEEDILEKRTDIIGHFRISE
jgi:uncharacterized protein